jgi:hypothetical protein
VRCHGRSTLAANTAENLDDDINDLPIQPTTAMARKPCVGRITGF